MTGISARGPRQSTRKIFTLTGLIGIWRCIRLGGGPRRQLVRRLPFRNKLDGGKPSCIWGQNANPASVPCHYAPRVLFLSTYFVGEKNQDRGQVLFPHATARAAPFTARNGPLLLRVLARNELTAQFLPFHIWHKLTPLPRGSLDGIFRNPSFQSVLRSKSKANKKKCHLRAPPCWRNTPVIFLRARVLHKIRSGNSDPSWPSIHAHAHTNLTLKLKVQPLSKSFHGK